MSDGRQTTIKGYRRTRLTYLTGLKTYQGLPMSKMAKRAIKLLFGSSEMDALRHRRVCVTWQNRQRQTTRVVPRATNEEKKRANGYSSQSNSATHECLREVGASSEITRLKRLHIHKRPPAGLIGGEPRELSTNSLMGHAVGKVNTPDTLASSPSSKLEDKQFASRSPTLGSFLSAFFADSSRAWQP